MDTHHNAGLCTRIRDEKMLRCTRQALLYCIVMRGTTLRTSMRPCGIFSHCYSYNCKHMERCGHRGFTLIELLTVVSIIGLLASIILASLASARDNARLAAGKQQDASLFHTIGDQVVGDWEFNECSGSAANDASGNSNTGTITIGSGGWSSDTPYGRGCSINFDGSATYVAINSTMVVHAPFTVSAWVKPITISTNDIVGSRGGGNAFDMKLQSVPNYIHGDIGDGTNWLNLGADANYQVPTGKWSFIVYSVTTNNYAIYVNGALVGSGSISGGVPLLFDPTHPLKIGQVGYSGEYFNGLIDIVRVYTSSVQ